MRNKRFNAPRRQRRDRGGGMVEFAVVVPVFFLLFFAIIELGRWFFIRETMENAVRQAARYAITGSHLSTTNGVLSRYDSIKQVAQKAAIGIPLDNISITSLQGGTNSAGGPGDTVKISITTTVHFVAGWIAHYFGGSGSNTFTVSATFRNENFPPGQTL